MSSKRGALRALILSDSALVDFIPPDRWAARGSIGVDAPDKPFAIIGALNDNLLPGSIRSSMPEDFEIWIHDNPGSYVRIDDILARLRTVMEGATHFTFNDFRISQVDVQGTGPDLSDDVLRTVTRSLRVRVLGRSL